MSQEELERFAAWLREGGTAKRRLSDSTISTYLKVASAASRATDPLSVIRPDLGASTKTKYLSALRQWLREWDAGADTTVVVSHDLEALTESGLSPWR